MIFNSLNLQDIDKARDRLELLISKKKIFEIIEKKKRRSISQNSYLHLILSYFACETGYTLEEVKREIFKKIVNQNIFYDGEFDNGLVSISRFRSTSELDTKEMTTAIERFRNYASTQANIYLPEPSDIVTLDYIENEIKKNETHL